jgi:acyl carrier protein
MSVSSTSETIREVLTAHARLMTDVTALNDGDDLYEHGMTSHATVSVMLALENEFDVEFPDSALRRSSFQSIETMRIMLEELGVVDSTK